MKLTLLIISFSLSQSIFSQVANNTNRLNEKNIYHQALTEYFKPLINAKLLASDSVYVDNEYDITDSLLPSCNNIKLVVLNYPKIRQKIELEGPIILYRILPLEYEGNYFSVLIIKFKVKLENNKLSFENVCTTKLTYQFVNGEFLFNGGK